MASLVETDPDADLDDADQGPSWLLRDPVRSLAILLAVLSLAVRVSVLKDSHFITDDFMLTSRAMEHDLGWDYLTRVHTGHFEPIGFGVMWLLAHFAPLDWGWTALAMTGGQVVLLVMVWKLLVELFGRHPLVLLPFTIMCVTPLTLPAFTWLAAAIIWLPLMIAISGAVRWHVRYVRSGAPRDAVWATVWYVVGLASFEKIAVYLPFIVVLTIAVAPAVPLTRRALVALVWRTRWVWVGYLVTSIAYLVLYIPGVRSVGNDSPVTAPAAGPLSDFIFLSVLRTFVPGTFGGPWGWQPTSYSLAIVDSPRVFDWLMWIVALAVVVGSVLARRHVGRFWVALLVYLIGSMATVAAGRVAYGGAIVALETRYLADAVIPLVIALGACLLPLQDERRPWTRTGLAWADAVPARLRYLTAGISGLLITALSFHAIGAYATFSTNNPSRAFLENTRTSLAKLPAIAEVYDTEIQGGIIGGLFAQYNLASRYLSPLVDDERRAQLYSKRTFTHPYVLNPAGQLVPMKINNAATSVPGVACYGARGGRVDVPLTQSLYEWGWAVRIGYLSDADTTAIVTLGRDSQSVQLNKGLGEVYLSLVSAGDTLHLSEIPAGINFCVGDAQVGFPTPTS